ncbi:IclR family transcriptional regulator [Paenibacillus aquistagni]|uniref:Transcriptional regulator, IclR family n=1 Tax=Paenibacillus aquistagni TaxID=1852522 RepID=A0A1X7LDD8_9BACL|nr:IclR family transcriptional regulator [Paenibacillus aquistagni]SMG51720.1 transcriptional regulator, IclR family [Paenibacillus aquistagni]
MEERGGKLTVRAVERALDILMCFAQDQDLTLTEIAGRIGLNKSTVHRLIATLEERGFILRNGDKLRLGYRVWELAANLTQMDDPAQLLLPEMERLRDQLGETVSLYVQDGDARIRIQAVQSNQAIRRVAPVGARLPLYVGASSKILLAFVPVEERERILNMMDWPANLDQPTYLKQLDEVRAEGFALSMEEREPGAAAVAVPVFGRDQQLAAALSISGPVSRLTQDMMIEYAPFLKEAAARMGTMMRTIT